MHVSSPNGLPTLHEYSQGYEYVQIHADLPKLRDLPPFPFLMHWGLEFISIHCMHGGGGGTAYTYTELCPSIHVHMCVYGHIFIASTHMNEQTGVNVSTCVGHMCTDLYLHATPCSSLCLHLSGDRHVCHYHCFSSDAAPDRSLFPLSPDPSGSFFLCLAQITQASAPNGLK